MIVASFDHCLPNILVHCCCAPCAGFVLELLASEYKCSVLFYNPNIEPQEEYEKRLLAMKNLLKRNSLLARVEMKECFYNNEDFTECVSSRSKEPEGGSRCSICFQLRLKQTARLAFECGFDYFTTTLSVSPHKNARLINEAGIKAAKEYGVNYLCADFKKNGGFQKSVAISKMYNLYRQNYCGCIRI